MNGQHGFVEPADAMYLGVPGSILHAVLLASAVCAFGFIMWRRAIPLRHAAWDFRLDHLGTRLAKALTIGFGQSRQPRYKVAGILHILIFFGFLVLIVRSLTLLGLGFASEFEMAGLGSEGSLYGVVKDYTALVVLLACLIAAARRAIFRPSRYHDRYALQSHGHEAYLILGLISLLMVADALYEGSTIAASSASDSNLPLASTAAWLVGGANTDALQSLHHVSFWVHNVALLFFLCYLPVSKHFHVITAIPNVFFMNLSVPGSVKPPSHTVSSLDDLDTFGVSRLEDFTWKHTLDFYSCTDCGRCTDHCPAYAVGAPLSPRMISIKSRDLLYDCYPVFGKRLADAERPDLVGDVIKENELWACTTCGACEEACPIVIEYVDKIVDMRRHLVDEGRVPPSLQAPLANLEKRGNPYGKMGRRRGDWTKVDANDKPVVRELKKGDEADLLFFTDSCAAYDPRIQETSRSMGRLLHTAGLDCGTMGGDEVDSGHEVRRIGEEGLFESLRDQNQRALNERGFSRIVTTDPHAYNAFRNDGYDVKQPVQHHTEVLAELVDLGKLQFGDESDDRTYTLHDPCYLGRHNGIYDAPRRVLDAMPGIKTVEMERSRNRSFCCGGGSLYLFHEGVSEARMGEHRLQMAEDAGAQVVVTACPFCMINLEDAIKTTGREGRMEIIDLAELVEQRLEQPTSA